MKLKLLLVNILMIIGMLSLQVQACDHTITVDDIDVDPDTPVCIDDTVDLDFSISTDSADTYCNKSGCSISSYSWSAPGGTTSSGAGTEVSGVLTFSTSFSAAGTETITVTATCAGAYTGTATIDIRIVEVEKVSTTVEGTTHESTTDSPGSAETVYVAKGSTGATISISATPNPSGTWPTSNPEWYFDDVDQSSPGSSITLEIDTVGTTIVKAKCGTSEKAIKIKVIDGLTIDPDPSFVAVGEKKLYKAWAVVSGVATDVTSSTEFRSDNGSFESGLGENELDASGTTASTNEGDDEITATYSTEPDATAPLTVVDFDLVSPTADTDFAMTMDGPTMPTVQLDCDISPTISDVEYCFVVGDEAANEAMEYADAPTDYDPPEAIESDWISSDTWDIDFGDDIYGGKVTTVTLKIRKDGDEAEKTISRDFYIIGAALTTTMCNNYIDSLSCDANIKAMAKVIAVKESSGTHFYPGSVVTHTRYPLKEVGGDGDGYGVMQLTSPVPSRRQIWDWKKNIDNAISEHIEPGYDAAVTHLAAHPIPAGADEDKMKRLGGYNRYNGGDSDRYWWWSTGPSNHNGVAAGWTKFGYCEDGDDDWEAYRDYNNDGDKDPDDNEYNIPNWVGGYTNTNANRAAKYADACILLE